MKIGILAVQGAFIEHRRMLEHLNITSFEIRQKKDAAQDFDGLILPGGESTVMGKLLHELDLFHLLKNKIRNGLPVLATCAGLILLAEEVSGNEPNHLATLPVRVRRNAYGRQLGSFQATGCYKGIGQLPFVFIRAPYIESAAPDVEVLATVHNHIVAVRYQNQLGVSFHPELTDSTKVHEHFITLVTQSML